MTPPTATGAARVRAGAAAPAPLRLPPAPRRVSGPPRHPRAAAARPAAGIRVFQRLIDHPWLERLVRGRAWIAIVATALLGIVAIQVTLLRLGAQIGTETGAVNAMIQRNQSTQAAIAEIEASHNLTTEASSLGMVYPPPGAVTYLEPNPGDARHAADVMEAPTSASLAAADAHPAGSSILTAVTTPSTTTASATSTALTPSASTGATAGAGAATTGPTAGAGAAAAGTIATTPPAGTAATSPATTSSTASTAGTAGTAPAGTAASTPTTNGQSGAGSTTTTAAGGTAAATTTAAGGTTAAGAATGAPAATNPTGP